MGEWQLAFGEYSPNVENRYVFEAVRESLALPDGVTLPDDFEELPCVAVDIGEVEIGIAAASTQIVGSNVSWELTEGTLAITGSGAIPDVMGMNMQPWAASRESITAVTIGGDITGIGNNAFNSCTNLASITFPDGLTKIGMMAFQTCINLTSITFEGETPPTITNLAFSGVSANGTVNVPNGTTSAYTSALATGGITIGSNWTMVEAAAPVDVGDFSIIGGVSGTDWSYASNALTIKTAGTYSIGMKNGVTAPTADRIVIDSNISDTVTINLDSVKIETAAAAALHISGGTSAITLNLIGDNELKSTKSNTSGISVGSPLTISGNGSLSTTGNGSGYGIIFTAPLEISGGTITAIGGNTGHGIYSSGTHLLKISGGTVNATGNGAGNGILNSGNIEITGDDTIVTATSAGSGSGIQTNSNGKIDISGGTVTATGAGTANGIYSSGGVAISGATVNAIGGSSSGGYGIGSGNNGGVEITGGEVTVSNVGTGLRAGSGQSITITYSGVTDPDTATLTIDAGTKALDSAPTLTDIGSWKTAAADSYTNTTAAAYTYDTSHKYVSFQSTSDGSGDDSDALALKATLEDFKVGGALSITISGKTVTFSGGTATITGSTSPALTIPAGITLVIDGGTLNVETSSSTGVQNNGTLTISGGELKVANSGNYGLTNKGTLSIEGGTVNIQNTGAAGISNQPASTASIINITGGTVNITNSAGIGIFNDSSSESARGQINISGSAKINIANTASNGINNRGDMAISGGEIAVESSGANTIGIANSTMSSAAHLSGKITMSGGKLTIKNPSGTGLFNSCSYDNYATLDISGGTVEGGNGSTGTIALETGSKVKAPSGTFNDRDTSVTASGEITVGAADAAANASGLSDGTYTWNGTSFKKAGAAITSVSAGTTTIVAAGGTSVITVVGTDLVDGIKVTAFDGSTATNITGTTTGSATSQTVTLTFPENSSTTDDKEYTIKASLDGGTNWNANTATVTVSKATGGGHWYTGQTSPFTISTAAELSEFSEIVNSGTDTITQDSFSGKIVQLANSIDLSTVCGTDLGSWTPIGTTSNSFKGTFDGKGYEITNLYINSTAAYQGLFRYVDGGAVKNLGVSGSVTVAGNNSYTGGIIGAMISGTVENCYFNGTVSGSSSASALNAGGIIGANYGTVKNCYNTGTISGSNNIGGIVGINGGNVQNCYNTGTISGLNNIGGIVGTNSSTSVSLGLSVAATGSTNVGCVAGTSSGTLTNNSARNDMTVTDSSGAVGITSLATGIHGVTLAVNGTVNQINYFATSDGWASDIWTAGDATFIIGAKLPTLKGFSSAQNPTLPGGGSTDVAWSKDIQLSL